MPEPIQGPKGTRDFYPEDMRVQNHIFDGWRKVCRAFGYEEYEGPTFENLELYTGKSGEEIVGQLYHFKDKGDRDLALRPELTPTLARMVNQKGPALRKPIKWFSIPRLYRYERSQKGRLREFFQLNMDIVGCDIQAAEIDLISAVIEMLKGFGLGAGDFSILISSRKLLSGYLDRLGIDTAARPSVFAALDKRSKVGEDGFRKILSEAGIADANRLEAFFQCRNYDELIRLVEGHEGLEGLSELRDLTKFLEYLGYEEFIRFDASIVRGLAYYTGTVFEVYDKAGSMRAIAGGGRYDNLLESLGGRPISGVGFGMGDVVLADLLKEKGLLPKGREGVDYYLADENPPADTVPGGIGLFAYPKEDLARLAQTLRAKGRSISYSLEVGRLKKQVTEANDQGVRKVIFFGSKRATKGNYWVRDLRSGEEKEVGESEL